MTVAAQNTLNLVQGDGVTTAFTWTFALPAGSTGSEIRVYVIDNASTPNVTDITGLGNYSLNVGASTITYPVQAGVAPLTNGAAALPAGWQLAIYRVEPIVQNTNLTYQGVFPAASVMAQLDYLTMICQQLQEQINRCVKYQVGQTPTSVLASAFITAVNAGLLATPASGTLAYLKGLASNNPTQWMFGIATDLGAPGQGSLMFYCGNVNVGDKGWFTLA